MEDGIIKESELVQLDGTIDKLIQSISALDSSYANAAASMKQTAASLAASLRSVSGATRQGRQAIDESSKSAARLAAAQEELSFALSETGKQVAWLKAQTRDVNRATVDQKQQIQAAATSYDKLKAEIKELTSFFRSLTKAEREDADFGGQVIADLRAKNTELKALNASIRPVVQSMTLLQKTEQQLAYWQSEEGKQVLALRAQIRELTKERKAEKVGVTDLEKAQQKLAFEQSKAGKDLAFVNEQIRKQQAENRLLAKATLYAGSAYKDLAIQYEVTKAQIDALDKSSEDYEQTLASLTNKAASLRARMNEMQKSTGNYSLNVGNYASAFDGLGQSVQQVLRELPTLRIGLDQFFLAISNNIPIFADMYAAEKAAFEGQKASIEAANTIFDEAGNIASKNTAKIAAEVAKLDKPIKKVIRAIFSWRTALVGLVTIFTLWGKDIVNWVSSLFQGEGALARLTRATKAIREEMKNTNADFGKNMVTIRKLSREWKALRTEVEKTQWIKDNASEWRKLDVAIYNVADAEKFFTDNTDNIKKAFQDRARAAAAYKITQDKFEQMLLEEEKLRNIKAEGPKRPILTVGSSTVGYSGGAGAVDAQEQAQIEYDAAVKAQQAKIDKLQQEVDLYFDLADAAQAAGDAILGTYVDPDKAGSGKGGLDLIEYIAKKKAAVEEASAEAATKAQTSEFAKRRKKAVEEYEKEVNDLKEVQRKNARILSADPDLKVKKGQLTPERKAELEAMQAQIAEAINQFKAVYNRTKSDIAADEKIFALQQEKALIEIKLATVREGSTEEYELRKKALQKQYELEIAQNRKLIASERQDESAIKAKYDKQIADVDTDQIISTKKKGISDIQLKLESIKAEGVEELNLRKQLLEEQYKLELLENSKLAANLQQTEAGIKAKYDKQIEDLEYEHQMRMLEIKQNAISQKLNITQTGSADELKLLLEQIDLEKQAALKANAQLAADLRQSEDEITAYYDAQARYARGATALSDSRATRTASTATLIRTAEQGRGKPRRQARRVVGAEGSLRREVYEIDTQLLDVNKQLELYYSNQLNLSKEQVAQLKLQKAELENQKFKLAGKDGKVSGFENFMHSVNENGFAGGLLEALGLDEAGIEAFNVAVDAVIDGLSQIIEAEIEAAEQAVEAAQERVSAAQAAYDAEIEARNNGYANSVDTARKELEQEKKNEEAKQKMLEQARKKQQALDAVTQASSLVTAVAGLWASYSTMGPASIVLAGIATAALFASFVASQAKAAQVAKQTYGEGGLEFLEGGSHASGNDIPLGTVNSEGKSMVAEGGEAMAIINKRNTKRYKRILPDIIDSLNKGTFEEKFLNAFNGGAALDFYTTRTDQVDLSKLEGDVRKIREQGDSQLHTLPDGTRIVYYKNIKRIIKS